MIDNRYYVEPANWSADEQVIRTLREQVFVDEQDVDPDLICDHSDPACVHVIARDSAGREAIGTARMSGDGKIGRMAVLADWRRCGVGSAMLQALLDQARERHLNEVYLNSQVDAVAFYQKHGFASAGETFVEAGIDHTRMTLALDASEPPPRRGGLGRGPQRESALITTDTLAGCRQAALGVMEQARYELCIYSRDLEAPLYDQDALLEQCRRIALSGSHAKLRVLVQDPTRAKTDGHRLVLLAHRLTTAIALRQPCSDDLDYNAAFLCNDTGGYLYRSLADRFDGESDLYNPLRCAELQRYFNEVWERAKVIDEFRRLSL